MEVKTSTQPNKRLRVLNIDGGGIKGIVPLYFLDLLEKITGKPVYDLFDFFSGTSIGGIISLLFSQRKLTAGELLVKMLGQLKNKIFPSKRFFSFALLKKSLYDPSIIEEVLRDLNGDISFKDAKGNFLITGSEVIEDKDKDKKKKCEPFVFVKNEGNSDCYKITFDTKAQDFFKFVKTDIDQDLKIWQIARVTSAAFPFFSSYNEIKGFEFMDGGFTYNNPCFLTIKYLEEIAKVPLENVFMLSLGCNMDEDSQSVQVDFLKKSIFSLNSELLSNVQGLNDNMNNVSYHALLLADSYLRGRHVRIAPTIMKEISLDNVDSQSISELQKTSRKMMKDLFNLTSVICRELGLEESHITTMSKKLKFPVIPRYFKFREFYKELDALFEQEVDNGELFDAVELYDYPEDVKENQKIIRLPEDDGLGGMLCCGRPPMRLSLVSNALTIGHLGIFKKFMKDIEDPFKHTEFGKWSPFHIAAANGELAGILMLIEEEYLVPGTLCIYSNCFTIDFKEELSKSQIDRLIGMFLSHLGKRYDEVTAMKEETPFYLAKKYENQEIISFYNLLKKLILKKN